MFISPKISPVALSGTLILTKQKPISENYGIGIEEHDKEGRVITLEFDKFYMVNCYTPNSKRELERLEYRQVWEDDFREYLNYYGGWGEMFGNVTGGGEYSSKTDCNPTPYVETAYKDF